MLYLLVAYADVCIRRMLTYADDKLKCLDMHYLKLLRKAKDMLYLKLLRQTKVLLHAVLVSNY